MSIRINGSTGVSGVVGTAGTPALAGASDKLGINFQNDQVNIGINTTNGVKFDNDGNIQAVGVVTASSFSGSGANLTFTGANISAATGTFTGNVSVGGTLTYEDVTNVDSVGLITARTGINVLAGGIDAVGVVTATSFSGDGSALTNLPAGGESNFVASGNISNGDTVVVNADGTVSTITGSGSVDPTVGVSSIFENALTLYTVATYDSANQRVIVAYEDDSNSDYGTAVVGTVTGTGITFGTPVVFESAATSHHGITYDSTNEKVVIAYRDEGNTNYGTAVVGDVSGDSISFGTPVVFESATTQYHSLAYDSSNDRVVISYRDGGNSNYGTSIVGTVSGTSISFGTAVVFESAATSMISSTYDSTNGKVVIVYGDGGVGDQGTAVVGTVSGTSISFGTAAVFEYDTTTYTSTIYDPNNNKVIIAYYGADNKGEAVVGTVSGTDITFGRPIEFNNHNTVYISAVYDSSNEKVVITYRDGSIINGSAVVGTVNDNSISFREPFEFKSGNLAYTAAAYDSTNSKVVVAYRDQTNSNRGTGVVFDPLPLTTNLTEGNFIGIAAEAISSGATGKISIVGGINEGQSGLTTGRKYYVDPTGGLSLNPIVPIGDITVPVVVAGNSISGTKILIKG